MGAHPYWYVVKYKSDINEALQELREREFRAGRYNPVIDFPDFPIGPHSPAPGAQHTTMAQAFLESEADGTRSIIDIERVSDEPGFRTAMALGGDVLKELFGTTRPTRAMVEAKDHHLLHELHSRRVLSRGHGAYFVIFKADVPDEIYFAGYSFD
jgi:hypothetical protein